MGEEFHTEDFLDAVLTQFPAAGAGKDTGDPPVPYYSVSTQVWMHTQAVGVKQALCLHSKLFVSFLPWCKHWMSKKMETPLQQQA